MKRISLLMLMGAIMLASCQSGERTTGEVSYSQPGDAPYTIKEVHPAKAIPGTRITISGNNFPEKGLEVYFGDVMVDSLESVSALAISVIVPRVKEPGKVKLHLRSRGMEIRSNSVPFSVEPIPADLPTVYFTTHKLYKGSVTDKGVLQIDELVDIGFPRGLHVDKKSNEIIYVSYYGQVFRKTSDSEPELIKKFPEGLESMVLDENKEWMYLADASSIFRMSMKDTTKVEMLYKNRQHPKSLRVNEATNSLIWCELDPLNIVSGSTDGKSEPKVIFDGDSGLTGPTCVEIDVPNQKIYVGDVSGFGNSRILEGDLQAPGTLTVLYSTADGVGENILHLQYDKERYLYAMNSKGVNQDILEDGYIVRVSIKDKTVKPELVMQPIHHGYLIAM